MKPYKITSMATFILLFFILIYNGKTNINNNNITLIYDTIFSFIFPAFIFFWSWIISYKCKEEKKGRLNYYLKIVVNVVLPYFICMIPYIIYKYGINNLGINDFANLLLEGNIAKQFEYVKIAIHLLIIIPIIEYFIKLNAKATIIITFALSIIFNLFSLDTYIYTKVFNYLIYMSTGILFSYHQIELTALLRNKSKYFTLYSVIIVLLTYVTTRFTMYNFLNPIIAVLYNLMVIIILCYWCYRNEFYNYKTTKQLKNGLLFGKPIITTSVFLLIEIVLNLFKQLLDYSILIMSDFMAFVVILMGILVIVLLDKDAVKSKKKNVK